MLSAFVPRLSLCVCFRLSAEKPKRGDDDDDDDDDFSVSSMSSSVHASDDMSDDEKSLAPNEVRKLHVVAVSSTLECNCDCRHLLVACPAGP
jgi:hypothetical protein